ncbi:hypothetical protein HNY73_007879 [Argiope bruennichi]|uniref:Type II toxin-antitoxin system RelE/ParE family toxin n=1 Tax=Argiope bruennichi TaxID=94029 RepID=A0A8T0F4P7_ARGBR|nr:hypothetical protein HNY73_007879 [Argiope bruennichi]
MVYNVFLSPQAEEQYADLPEHVQHLVDVAMEDMEINPFRKAKKLKNCSIADWRRHVARTHRILFNVQGEDVKIVAILPKTNRTIGFQS